MPISDHYALEPNIPPLQGLKKNYCLYCSKQRNLNKLKSSTSLNFLFLLIYRLGLKPQFSSKKDGNIYIFGTINKCGEKFAQNKNVKPIKVKSTSINNILINFLEKRNQVFQKRNDKTCDEARMHYEKILIRVKKK